MRTHLHISHIIRFTTFALCLWGTGSPLIAQTALSVDTTAVQAVSDSELVDSLPLNTAPPSDSMPPALEHKVDYVGDTIHIYFSPEKTLLLKGKAQITYGDIRLEADNIHYFTDRKTVIAWNNPDSTGKLTKKVKFTQGKEVSEADSLNYRFDSQKALIINGYKQEGEGHVSGGRIKKVTDEVFFVKNVVYSTCDANPPHFGIRITRGKMVKGKLIVTGPSYMEIEQVPLYPVGLPLGFYPMTKTYSSGVIFPSYGEERNRGLFLREGGYYWAASDYFDLKLTGDIYTSGSWAVRIGSQYKKKYKFTGNPSFHYNRNISNSGLSNETVITDYRIRWTHRQDPKAHPYQTFSASVDYSSQSYNSNNAITTRDLVNTQKSSSISFSRRWERSPVSFSGALRHSQNDRDSSISLTLPDLTTTVKRQFPFRRKKGGKKKWYEKIGINYGNTLKNRANGREDKVLSTSSNLWVRGVKHTASTSLSLQPFKIFSVTPSVNYTERWYFRSNYKRYDAVTKEVKTDTVDEFRRVYDYSTSVGMSTNLYLFFGPRKQNLFLQKVRWHLQPSASFSYRPNFGQESYGYYSSYQDSNGRTNEYVTISSRDAIYGMPGKGESASLSLSLKNVVEAKFKNKKDTTGKAPSKKVQLIKGWDFSTSYNHLAEQFKWSVIRSTFRTAILKRAINISMTLDPYGYEMVTASGRTTARRVDKAALNVNNTLLRLTSLSTSTSFRLGPRKKKKKQQQKEKPHVVAPNNNPLIVGEEEDYFDFSLPWSLSITYSVSYRKPLNVATWTQTLRLNGSLTLARNWKITGSSGYDIEKREITHTSFGLSRSMHCWNMTLSLIPFGTRQSYSFYLGANASMLRDLKIQKTRSWYDNYTR